MAELGFEDVSELVELEKDNPELFMDVVDNLVLQGKFDDDPEIKKAVQDFSRAKRALIDFDKAGNGYEDHNLAVEKAADAYLETQKTAVLDPSVPLPPKF